MHSMRADLHTQNYQTTEGYEAYIYGSADVVGLMCLKVFVNGNAQEYNRLKPAAMKLGSAFQKVNFLRDLKDDTEILSRNYFPILAQQSLNTRVKKQIIEEIEDDFAEAYKGIVELPLVAKFGVYTAYVYYRKLLQKIKRSTADELRQKRIRISNPAKAGLLAQSYVSYKLNLL